METAKYGYWEEDNIWLGYLEEFPIYMTQGETIEELKENLKDLHKELTGGSIPNVRRVDVLKVA